MDKFYQMFKEDITIFYNLFQRIKAKGIVPNSFYEASITLKPKWGKDIGRKKKTTSKQKPNTQKRGGTYF